MRYIPLKAIGVLSALGLAVGSAIAQQQAGEQQLDPSLQALEPSTQELMTEYDQDDSQSLSEEEFTRLYEERLRAASAQSQGQVNQGGQANQGQAGGQDQGLQDLQGGPGQAGQEDGNQVAEIFSNLDSDGNMELDDSELAQVIALIDPEIGGRNASTGQGRGTDLNPQVGANTEQPLAGQAEDTAGLEGQVAVTGEADRQQGGAQSSTVFAGDVRTSTRDIGTDEEPGQDTSLTAQAGADRQVGEPSRTAPDSRENAVPGVGGITQNDPQPGRATQDQQNPQGQFGQQQGAQPGQQAGAQSPLEQMANTQPDQLRGMSVRSMEGEDIGEIDEVVRDRDSGDLYAVISSGGILGIGADKSAVRLSELQMENDAVVYASPQEQLEQQPYEESRFEPVEAGERQAAAEDEQPQERPA